MQKISIIGSGKVAWHLAKKLYESGFEILEIYSRNPENAQSLAQKVQAQVKENLYFSANPPDLILISVTDNALAEVIHRTSVATPTLVAHTSGSMGIEVFEGQSYPAGVFYPLQTFTKNRAIDFSKVPICLEAKEEHTYIFLEKIARKISENVNRINSVQRRILHIAAVFACNFVNHLLAISKNILEQQELSFDLLKPLIEETISKALIASHPKEVQTGPAIRKDNLVMQKHLDFLSENPNYQEIYQILSKSIINFQ